MLKVKCNRVDSGGALELGHTYLVDTLEDTDAYVHLVGGRYIGMYPSTWFEVL